MTLALLPARDTIIVMSPRSFDQLLHERKHDFIFCDHLIKTWWTGVDLSQRKLWCHTRQHRPITDDVVTEEGQIASFLVGMAFHEDVKNEVNRRWPHKIFRFFDLPDVQTMESRAHHVDALLLKNLIYDITFHV